MEALNQTHLFRFNKHVYYNFINMYLLNLLQSHLKALFSFVFFLSFEVSLCVIYMLLSKVALLPSSGVTPKINASTFSGVLF